MRITTGHLKGAILAAPRHVRPTEDRVRQALFNIIGPLVPGSRVIDACAGSGALGLEALSREAAEVTFLESDPRCLRAIHENLQRLAEGRVPGRWSAIGGDVVRSLQRLGREGRQAELILLDPPYRDAALATKALRAVADYAILARAGMLCLEHASSSQHESSGDSLTLVKQHRYGRTVLSFYRAAASGAGS